MLPQEFPKRKAMGMNIWLMLLILPFLYFNTALEVEMKPIQYELQNATVREVVFIADFGDDDINVKPPSFDDYISLSAYPMVNRKCCDRFPGDANCFDVSERNGVRSGAECLDDSGLRQYSIPVPDGAGVVVKQFTIAYSYPDTRVPIDGFNYVYIRSTVGNYWVSVYTMVQDGVVQYHRWGDNNLYRENSFILGQTDFFFHSVEHLMFEIDVYGYVDPGLKNATFEFEIEVVNGRIFLELC